MRTVQEQDHRDTVRYRIVVLVCVILFLLIAVFFLYRYVYLSPVRGTWVSSDGSYELRIKADRTTLNHVKTAMKELNVQGSPEVDLSSIDDEEATVTGNYTFDRENNVLVLSYPEIGFYSSYDCSIIAGKMELTDRESGEHYTFRKK